MPTTCIWRLGCPKNSEARDASARRALPTTIQGAVTFSGAIDAQAKDKPAAKALIELLTSPEAKEKFRAVGFNVS